MQTQTQPPRYSVHSIIPTKILIPKHIEIGRLIGRDGRNLKPIADGTGTFIHVNTTTNPARIEIKIKQLSNASYLSPKGRINEAENQLNDLIKKLEEKGNRRKVKPVKNRINEENEENDQLIKELKKEGNRRKVPLKKKENDIGFLRSDYDRHATLKYQKGIESKKERKYSKREMNEQINYEQQALKYFKHT